MLRLSKDGTKITSSRERIYGYAQIIDFDESGDPNYAGETTVDWDSQATVMRDGERVYFDEDGDEYLESETKLISEEEFEADHAA